MRRAVAGVWDVPDGGFFPALSIVGAFFLAGGLAGCILASCVDGGGGESEVSYETYGGKNGNFKSPSIPAAKLLDGKKFIGRLSRRAFRPCAEPERQPPAPQQTQ